MVRIVTLALLTLTLSFLAVANVWAADDKKAPEDSRLNKGAPTFDLPGSDGKNHKLTDYKGKWVVLHWQSNKCPWDQAYQPILNKLANDNTDVVFLGINSNKTETMEEVKATQDSLKIPYLILKDKGNKVADAYGAETTPHMFIIDPAGKLVYLGGIEKLPSSVNAVGKSKDQYLSANLASIKEGKALAFPGKTVPKGCTIKRE
jgi:peroxiredoxin